MSLSKQFAFGPLPVAAPIRAYLSRVMAQNQSYVNTATGVTTAQIVIPASASSFIDCKSLVLSFDVTNTSVDAAGTPAPQAVSINGSAHSFIGALKVFSGQNSASLLEDLNNYAETVQLLHDLHRSADEWSAVMSMNEGTSDTISPANLRLGATLAASSTTRFQIPLLSFLSTLGNHAIPIHDGFSAFITWNGAANVLYAGAGTLSYTVTNVRLEYNTLELPMSLTGALYSAGGGSISIPTVRWQTFSSTIPSGSTLQTALLGIPYRSLKSLLGRFRWANNLTNATGSDPITHCPNPYLNNWFLTLAGQRIPSMTMDSDQLTYTNLLQSRHILNAAHSGTLIRKSDYMNRNAYTLGTRTMASYAFGYDFDVLSGAEDRMSSGIDVSSKVFTWTGEFNTGATLVTGAVGMQALFFAEGNSLITHVPGIGCTVSY